jgi:hypothetical protein
MRQTLSKLKFTLDSIPFTVALFTVLSGLLTESAYASYSCGPHLATYNVRSLGGASGQGVRCVRVIPDNQGNPVGFFWYGEGVWEGQPYRHIGQAFYSSGNGTAGDIYGNGEAFDSFFNETLLISHSGESIPNRIQVTGAWNEEWTLEADNVVLEYTSTLGSVQNCGSSFELPYTVRDTTGERAGEGIRCRLIATGVWYGEGNWGGTTYAHIGSLWDGYGNAGAFDICEPSRFGFCNAFDWGSIVLDGTPGGPGSGGFRVTGAWQEEWIPR